MTTPTGPTEPTPEPQPQGPKGPSGEIKPMDSKDPLLQSPFAKMFAKTGAMPTVKEMRMIMNQILKQEVDEIKRQDAEWKKAMKKLKKTIEGKE